MRRGLGVAVFVIPCAFVTMAACTLPQSPDLQLPAPAASKVVGPTGGVVATNDGSASVDIPAGALTTDTTITITANASASPPSGVTTVGTAYVFGPDGLKFAKPVTVTLPFDASKLPSGVAASTIAVYSAPDRSTSYERLDTSVKDDAHVTATTVHFSTDVAAVASTAGSGGGKVCAAGGEHCGSTAGGGPGCGAQTPTCATASCKSYPGAQVEGCTNTPDGYDAQCCFPEGTPVCFPVGAGRACGGGASCPPPPTCESSSPCGSYPGATMQSCTNEADGFHGICCLPAGSPLPGGGSPQDGGTTNPGLDGGGSGGTDGGGPGGGSCVLTGGGSASTCDETTDCNGHHYEMTCNGTTCTCMTDGQQTGTVSQGAACTGPSAAQTVFNAGCGYPGTSNQPPPPPDGGVSDGGAGGSCTPACGGNGTSCNCNSTCNGHNYVMACNGVDCKCGFDGQIKGTFSQGATCVGSTDALAAFSGQCGFPVQ